MKGLVAASGVESLLEIIDWTQLDSIDPFENDKETRLETIKLIDFQSNPIVPNRLFLEGILS